MARVIEIRSTHNASPGSGRYGVMPTVKPPYTAEVARTCVSNHASPCA
jgi:hypothetical protein